MPIAMVLLLAQAGPAREKPAQEKQEKAAKEKPAKRDAQFQGLKEEDKDLTQQTEYVFNPIQATKEMKVGEFYWKKGSYRAAAGRFEEATKWDPGLAEAYFRLAEAKEKMAEKELEGEKKRLAIEDARKAFEKYLKLAPEGKRSKKARKLLAKLPQR